MNVLTEHLDEVGETYFEHMGRAAGLAAAMLAAAGVCFVHAILPFVFVHAGSDRIRRLHGLMAARRRSVAAMGEDAAARPEGRETRELQPLLTVRNPVR